MDIDQAIIDALQAGDAEELTSLLAAEPSHDSFIELEVDCDDQGQRRAFLAAAIACLPVQFIRDLELASNLLGFTNIGILHPEQMSDLFVTLLTCALREENQVMLARLHALDPKDSETIGSALDVLGHEMIQSGEFTQAIEVFELALQFPSPGTTVYANALFVAQKDNTGLPVDVARNQRWLDACLPHGPENAGIFFNAACVFMENGEPDRAVEHIRLSVYYDSNASLDVARRLSADPLFDGIRERVDAIFSQAPKGVDSRAWWDEDAGEWVHGDKDEEGRLQGLVKYWRPGGTLCCETEYVDGEANGRFTRYHESGEVSRVGHMKNGKIVGLDRATRSYEFTTEKAIPAKAPQNVHTIETNWEGGGFTHQVLRDIEGNLLAPDGSRVPERPPNVPAEAYFLGDVWHAGNHDDEEERTGTWRYFDADGVLFKEELYDGTTCAHTMLLSERDDATFELGLFSDGTWMGRVLLLDEDRNEVGSFDSTGADLIDDPALTNWVEDVRAVDWAALESAYHRSERIAHHLVVFAVAPDATSRDKALDNLYGFFCHQGSTYPASAAALGLLVELSAISEHEDVRYTALELVADMALMPRHAYDQWSEEGHSFDCITELSKRADELQELVLGSDDSVLRWRALRCLGACFENPKAAEFLREDGRDEEEQALRIACLGNLKAIPAATLEAAGSLSPLLQLALVYGSALWWDGPEVPHGLELILNHLDTETPAVFYAFPYVEGTLIDELAFMAKADEESVDKLTDKLLKRLTEVQGMGACVTVGATLQVVFAREEFGRQQWRVLQALVAKDDLWLTSEGEPAYLGNFMEILVDMGFPTERDAFAKFAQQWLN